MKLEIFAFRKKKFSKPKNKLNKLNELLEFYRTNNFIDIEAQKLTL